MSTKSQPNHHQTRGGCAVTTSSSAVPKKKPVFIKVEQLTPGSTGNNVVVNILEATNIVLTKPRVTLSMRRGPTNHNYRISECLVGDDTGTILFTARNDQVDLMKPGNTVILRNAKIDMFKGSMRLAVDKWGRIEVSEPATFVVKEDNNLSLVEYELVTVPNDS